MSYQPSHAKPGSLTRLAARSGVIASAAAIAAATAGSLAPVAANASATTPLQVSFGTRVQDDGSSAAFDSSGDPVLTLGSGASTTGAYVRIDNVAGTPVPSSEPSFTTDHYTGGSPRYLIYLSNNKFLVGYPAASGLNGSDMAWGVGNGAPYTSYQTALASAGVDSSVTVTSAQIVADGDQAAGTTDTLTNVQYNGQTVGGGTITLGSESTQHATEGTAYSLSDAATTTSSDPALTYHATGLPSGLSIDSTSGTISGTPTESGQYAVTVHATDVYGDGSNYQHFVMDVSSGVTYSASPNGTEGVIQNAYSGKYLNVAASGNYATGDDLIQWGSAGASHEKFEIVTIKNNSGTVVGGYLEAVSPNGQGYYVTASGEGQLSLGGEVLGTSTADLRPVLKSDADMLKDGSYYTFPNDSNDVMDDSGWSTANGAKVIAYAKNGGENQQWSLP